MGILYNVKNLLIKKFDCIDLYDKGHKIEIVLNIKISSYLRNQVLS